MEQLTKLTDRDLVAAYANNNNEAFDVLLQRHQQKVYSYILHIVKNKDVADDIFQETFVKAIMTIKQGRYMEHGKFSGLAHTYRPQSHNRLFPSGKDRERRVGRRRRNRYTQPA